MKYKKELIPTQNRIVYKFQRATAWIWRSALLFFVQALPIVTADMALSPDGDRLIIARYGDLWLYDISGSHAPRRRLTTHPANDGFPCWTHHSDTIIFISDRGGQYNLYSFSLETQETCRLSDHRSDEWLCDISPDGRHILFASDRGDHFRAEPQLYQYDRCDGSLQRLPNLFSRAARYSPDGRLIALLLSPTRQLAFYNPGQFQGELQFAPPGTNSDLPPIWLNNAQILLKNNDQFKIYDLQSRALTPIDVAIPLGALELVKGNEILLALENDTIYRIHFQNSAPTPPLTVPFSDLTPLADTYAGDAPSVFEWISATTDQPIGAILDRRNLLLYFNNTWQALYQPQGTLISGAAFSPLENGLFIARYLGGKSRLTLYIPRPTTTDILTEYQENTLVVSSELITLPTPSPNGLWLFYRNGFTPILTHLKTNVANELSAPGKTLAAAWSPDSRYLACVIGDTAYQQILYIYDLIQKIWIPVTPAMAEIIEPQWTPNGHSILYIVRNHGARELWRKVLLPPHHPSWKIETRAKRKKAESAGETTQRVFDIPPHLIPIADPGNVRVINNDELYATIYRNGEYQIISLDMDGGINRDVFRDTHEPVVINEDMILTAIADGTWHRTNRANRRTLLEAENWRPLVAAPHTQPLKLIMDLWLKFYRYLNPTATFSGWISAVHGVLSTQLLPRLKLSSLLDSSIQVEAWPRHRELYSLGLVQSVGVHTTPALPIDPISGVHYFQDSSGFKSVNWLMESHQGVYNRSPIPNAVFATPFPVEITLCANREGKGSRRISVEPLSERERQGILQSEWSNRNREYATRQLECYYIGFIAEESIAARMEEYLRNPQKKPLILDFRHLNPLINEEDVEFLYPHLKEITNTSLILIDQSSARIYTFLANWQLAGGELAGEPLAFQIVDCQSEYINARIEYQLQIQTRQTTGLVITPINLLNSEQTILEECQKLLNKKGSP